MRGLLIGTMGLGLSVACAGSDGTDALTPPGDAALDTTPPSLVSIAFETNPENHLSGFLHVTTDEPAQLSLSVLDGHDEVMSFPDVLAYSVTHRYPVVGLRPGESFSFRVTVTDAFGNARTDESFVHATAPLAADFPTLEVVMSRPDTMQPGLTLFNVMRWASWLDQDFGMLLAVDERGRVSWYHKTAHHIGDFKVLPNGNIIYLVSVTRAVEITNMGQVVDTWSAEGLGVDTFHHELFVLDQDRFLTLGTELRRIGGYPDGEHNVVGDTVLEFTRDHQLIHNHSLFDVLDPLRTTPSFHEPFWNARYPEAFGGTKDWTHANAVIRDPADDNLIVSVRHQDWIIKIDRSTGLLLWRLGQDGDFALEEGSTFAYHPHAPKLQPDGNLLVYDNGNLRPLGGGEPPYSRAVEYRLNTSGARNTWSVQQVWEYRGAERYFAPFLGDAERLENGNTLVTDGGMLAHPEGIIDSPINTKSARLVEVTPGPNPVHAFELRLVPNAASPVGYSVFRATRVPR